MFNKLRGLIKAFKYGRASMNKTYEAQKLITIALGSTLFDKYQIEMNRDKAQVLSAQVINYLTGKDINRAIMVSEEPLKSKIIAIKHIVREMALIEMNNDRKLREMIVHYLRFKNELARAYKGYSEVLTETEQKQVNDLLRRYEDSVHYIIGPDEYLALAQEFFNERIQNREN